MGQKTFDMLMHLASVGYTVKFSKAYERVPAQVLRIELQKGDNHQVELIDISLSSKPWTGFTTDDLVSRGLERARWEFEYEFEREH